MKFIKRFFIFSFIILILLVAAAFLAPVIFKDQIIELIKTESNKQLNAEIDFEDVSLSFFRDFPNLSVGIQNFSLTGIDEFDDLPLAQAKRIAVSVDVWSLISPSRPITIESASIDNPKINIMVLNNGKANYDIARSSNQPFDPTQEDSSGSINLSLKQYDITEAKVTYEDRSTDLDLFIEGLNHSGSGNYSNNIFNLAAHTDIKSIDLTYGITQYLKEVQLNWDATLAIDQNQSKYTIEENTLAINALALDLDGFVKMLEDGLEMDLSLKTPQNDFKNLFSLIPDAYSADFDRVDSRGSFELDAQAQGVYKFDQSTYPAFSSDLSVQNGYVKYPGLPLAVENIQAAAKINSPGSNFDDLTVEASKIAWKIGDHPFDATFYLKTPLSDPDVKSTIDGTIDLNDLKQAFPNYVDSDMAGVFDFDVAVAAKQSTIEAGRYDQVNMGGNVTASKVRYPLEAYGYPTLAINAATLEFTPQKLILNRMDATAGTSDLQARGSLDNVLAYFSPDKTMTGDFDITSKYFNADEWYSAEQAETADENFKDTTTVSATDKPFDRFDIRALVGIARLQYDIYQLNNTIADVRVRPNDMDIRSVTTRIKDSDFKANGAITNLFNYLYEDGVLGGRLALESNQININSLYNVAPTAEPLTPQNSSAAGDYTAPAIPKNINLTIQADVNKVKYAQMELRDIDGQLVVVEQAAIMNEVKARGLGGDIKLSGQYDTKDPKKPYFKMKYDVVRLDFVESFKQANTFRTLAPIANYMEGKYSSSMIIEGILGPNLYPDYNTLNAKGFLETVGAVIKGFEPLQKLGNTLNIEELKDNLAVQDTRNFFEMKNGFIELAPFDVKVEGITMNVKGRHSITSELDYEVKASVPKEKLEEGALGSLVSGGLSFLEKQAGQLGIKSGDAQFVNVGLNITGSSKQPTVKIDILGLGKGGEQSTTPPDSTRLKESIESGVDSGKSIVKKEAGKLVDSAKQEGDAIKDTLKDAAREKLEKVLGKEAKAEADSIKKALEKFNPFKKKKSGN